MADDFTLPNLVWYGQMYDAAVTGKRVKWAVEGDTDRIVEGVARGFTTQDGMHFPPDRDVREAFFRVSGTMEHFIPVKEVMELFKQGLFVVIN